MLDLENLDNITQKKREEEGEGDRKGRRGGEGRKATKEKGVHTS